MSGESKTTHRKSGKQPIISQHCSHLIHQAVSDGDFIDDWLSVEIKSCNFNSVVTKINVTDLLVCFGWNPGWGFFPGSMSRQTPLPPCISHRKDRAGIAINAHWLTEVTLGGWNLCTRKPESTSTLFASAAENIHFNTVFGVWLPLGY